APQVAPAQAIGMRRAAMRTTPGQRMRHPLLKVASRSPGPPPTRSFPVGLFLRIGLDADSSILPQRRWRPLAPYECIDHDDPYSPPTPFRKGERSEEDALPYPWRKGKPRGSSDSGSRV